MNELNDWLIEDEFPAVLFYKTLLFTDINNFEKEHELLMQRESEIRFRCFANNTNNEYDILIRIAIQNGALNMLKVLSNIKVVTINTLDSYLSLSIEFKKEEIGIYILNNPTEFFNDKPNILTNDLDKIIDCFENNLNSLALGLILFSISKYNKESSEFSTTVQNKLEKIFDIVSKTGELDYVKVINTKAPNLFNDLYTDIIVQSLERGYVDIFEYCSKVFKFSKLPNRDKLQMLELALKNNEKFIFEIILKIMQPVYFKTDDGTGDHLLKKAKEANRDIYAILYTIAGKEPS